MSDKVLYVEDDPIFQEIFVSHVLKKSDLDIDILTCSNEIEALDLIENNDFKAVITDLSLKEMKGGAKVASEAAKSCKKIIIYTGYPNLLEGDKRFDLPESTTVIEKGEENESELIIDNLRKTLTNESDDDIKHEKLKTKEYLSFSQKIIMIFSIICIIAIFSISLKILLEAPSVANDVVYAWVLMGLAGFIGVLGLIIELCLVAFAKRK